MRTQKKEDRIIITGLSTNIPKPNGEAEIRGWARAAVDAALNAIIPDLDKKSSFVVLVGVSLRQFQCGR